MNRDKLWELRSQFMDGSFTAQLIDALLEDKHLEGCHARRWDEWTEEEKIEYATFSSGSVRNSETVNKAIDIALRGNYE